MVLEKVVTPLAPATPGQPDTLLTVDAPGMQAEGYAQPADLFTLASDPDYIPTVEEFRRLQMLAQETPGKHEADRARRIKTLALPDRWMQSDQTEADFRAAAEALRDTSDTADPAVLDQVITKAEAVASSLVAKAHSLSAEKLDRLVQLSQEAKRQLAQQKAEQQASLARALASRRPFFGQNDVHDRRAGGLSRRLTDRVRGTQSLLQRLRDDSGFVDFGQLAGHEPLRATAVVAEQHKIYPIVRQASGETVAQVGPEQVYAEVIRRGLTAGAGNEAFANTIFGKSSGKLTGEELVFIADCRRALAELAHLEGPASEGIDPPTVDQIAGRMELGLLIFRTPDGTRVIADAAEQRLAKLKLKYLQDHGEYALVAPVEYALVANRPLRRVVRKAANAVVALTLAGSLLYQNILGTVTPPRVR